MKQRYKWVLRVGGVLSQGGKKQSGWNLKKKVERRETAGECIREDNYTADLKNDNL